MTPSLDEWVKQAEYDLNASERMLESNLPAHATFTIHLALEKILKAFHPNYKLEQGPADKIVKLIIESDSIKIIIGTRINIAHQDPHLPIELEIRRTVVNRIATLLEEKFLKKVTVMYI